MARPSSPGTHLIGNRVASAKVKAEKVQVSIELAEAELHLAHEVISDKLSETVPDPDLAFAVNQTSAVEEKLRDAGQDLQDVTELLHSEERDNQRLEQALAQYQESDGLSVAGARSGTGSASVIEHLRELTRHKLNTDAADPVRTPRAAEPGAESGAA